MADPSSLGGFLLVMGLWAAATIAAAVAYPLLLDRFHPFVRKAKRIGAALGLAPAPGIASAGRRSVAKRLTGTWGGRPVEVKLSQSDPPHITVGRRPKRGTPTWWLVERGLAGALDLRKAEPPAPPTGDPEFDRRHLLIPSAPGVAPPRLAPAARRLLLEAKPEDVELWDGGLRYAYKDDRPDEATLRKHLDLATALAKTLGVRA